MILRLIETNYNIYLGHKNVMINSKKKNQAYPNNLFQSNDGSLISFLQLSVKQTTPSLKKKSKTKQTIYHTKYNPI